MDEIKLWTFVQQKLKEGTSIALMLVPQSKGSSPGRQGHMMAVAGDATMMGTIGGGAMEYKQVEACKKALQQNPKKPTFQQLIHDKADKKTWSGLTCSGEQTILSFFWEEKDLPFVNKILVAAKAHQKYALVFTSINKIELKGISVNEPSFVYDFRNEETWSYQFTLALREKVYLIGGGHVGLALCKQLSLLDFEVILIDNRADLPTEEYDQFISQKIITSYQKVSEVIETTAQDYIILMSFSSALDALVLSQLIDKPSYYIGMMASQTKAERIRTLMLDKGFTTAQYNRVETPIGLPMKCKSPAEIAVSVAAQLITYRNR